MEGINNLRALIKTKELTSYQKTVALQELQRLEIGLKEAKWSADERLQAFYGIQEHSNTMWFLLKDILEKEQISEGMKAKIKKTIYPKIDFKQDKEDTERKCPHCGSKKVEAWGEDADRCMDCELSWSV